MIKTQVVSSRWTLTLKLLLPTFWFCFFGGSTFLLFVMPPENAVEPFLMIPIRYIMLIVVLSVGIVYYYLFYTLKWVSLDEERMYISNFMDTYKYTYDSVARIEETKVLCWNKVTLHFYEPTKFGNTVAFYGSYYWHYYLKKHPEVLKQLLSSEVVEQ
jgi:hypothetical protein